MSQKLSAFFSYFTSRYAPAFITLLVLAGGFYFYFNVIVSKNEADLRDRSFRGLQRMGINMSGKISDYAERNADNFLEALLPKKDALTGLLKKPDTSALAKDYGLEAVTVKDANDSAPRFQVIASPGWKLFFRGKKDSIAAYAPVKEFIEPLLRRDLFSEYLFAYGDNILFDELNISHQKQSEFITRKGTGDTTKRGTVRAGETQDINIGGRDYKLFLLSFTGPGSGKFTIGGYMPLDNYIHEQRYIPTYAIIWMVIGIMMVVLMFPLLKVFLMHRSEQLMARNAISSMATLHVIGAIVVLIAINSYVYFTMVMSTAKTALKELATATEQAFINELDASLAELDNIKAAVKNGLPLADSVIHLPNARTVQQRTASGLAGYRAGAAYPYFRNVAWTDESGQQVYRWTTTNYVPQKIDVGDRDYFKAVTNGDLWLRNGHEYYLTGVSSWVSKEKLAVISEPFSVNDTARKDTKGLNMITLGGPFRSLFNALLPEGYGFCLVKENGDVIFHIDQNRSLNENLVEECSDNGYLQSFLQTRSAGYTSSRYSGSTQQFYVNPVAGTPFFVVTYRDLRLIWSEDLDVISACSILCTMNLAVILIALLIIQASAYRQSLLQSRSILFTWLRPNKDLKNAYRSVSLFYLASMILQVLFFILYTGRDQLCLIGIGFSYSYVLLSYMYYLFAVYKNANTVQQQLNKKPLLFLGAFYIFTATIFTINLHSGHGLFITAQLLLLGAAWVFTCRPFYNSGFLNRKIFRWWYVLSMFSFIAATSITPMLIFYCLSFKEERLLSLKHNQLAFARQLAQVPVDTLSQKQEYIQLSYTAPFYFQNFADSVVSLKKTNVTATNFIDGFENLYRRIKPSFSSHSREMEFLIKKQQPSGNDFKWLFNAGPDTLQFHYYTRAAKTYFNSPGIGFFSRLKISLQDTGNTMKKEWIYSLLLIGVLLFFLWGFNYLLNRLIRKIFFEGYDNSSYPSTSDLSFINALPEDGNIFINGPVNSGKHRMLLRYLQKNNVEVIDVDLGTLTSKKAEDLTAAIVQAGAAIQPPKRAVVLLRHFEIGMNDLSVTEKKLLLFEYLLQHRQQTLVLSSRSFDAMQQKESGKPDGTNSDYTNRWSNVMNRFYNLYHRWSIPEVDDAQEAIAEMKEEMTQAGRKQIEKHLQGYEDSVEKRASVRSATHYFKEQLEILLDRVDSECAHSDFLWHLRPTVLAHIKEYKKELMNFDFQSPEPAHLRKVISRRFTTLFEHVCLKIQALAANYYLSIWQSMNRDEQRTLFDIGLDEMVNPGNRAIASRLANLGLVKPEPHIACYEVMNLSFRNFIFTQLDKSEVKTLQADADESGSWNSFQLPVLMVVIAIGIFLFTTQKDAFTNLITYLGAAAGGIAALLKVLGMIPSNKN